MAKLKTLRDGLLEELRVIYSAEHQMLRILPKLTKKATDSTLAQALKTHIDETKGQVERLQNIAEQLGAKLSGKTCLVTRAFAEQAMAIIAEENSNKALLDAMLIGAIRRIKSYELAAYNQVISIAKKVGEIDAAKLLTSSLAEEKAMDLKLSLMIENWILADANNSKRECDEIVDDDQDEQRYFNGFAP